MDKIVAAGAAGAAGAAPPPQSLAATLAKALVTEPALNVAYRASETASKVLLIPLSAYRGSIDQKGRPIGQATLYLEGATIEGMFKNGVITVGTRHEETSGNVYKGELENVQMHGQGTMTYKNGSRYEGAWKNGKIHGQGKMVYDGRTFDGKWIEGKLDGEVVVIEKNGSRQDCFFKMGQQQ